MRVIPIVALRKNDASRTMERARSIHNGRLRTKQTAFVTRRISEGIGRNPSLMRWFANIRTSGSRLFKHNPRTN